VSRVEIRKKSMMRCRGNPGRVWAERRWEVVVDERFWRKGRRGSGGRRGGEVLVFLFWSVGSGSVV
jgi:hypothetical protein